MEKESARVVHVRKRTTLEQIFTGAMFELSDMVDNELGIADVVITRRSAPFVGFTLTSTDEETGKINFLLDAQLSLAPNFTLISIKGVKEDGKAFSGKVRMFMSDTLITIARRISTLAS